MMISLFRALVLIGVSTLSALGAGIGTLQAGAAKVDITPAADAQLPMSGYAGRKEGFKGIHDHIYARAVVVGDGTRLAAVVAWELIGVPNAVWEELSQRIAREIGIPVEYLMLAAVHDHAAPSPAGMYGDNSPKSASYTKGLEDATVEAVRKAKESLQPAKIGIGTAQAYVNINRREYSPKSGGWWLGYNPQGPSDKTVTVIRFDALSGKPIAFLINYPVHAVVMGPDNYQVSGDLAGATSRFVENYYRGKKEDNPRSDAGAAMRRRPEEFTEGVVAVWTSGAAGDQNPITEARGEDFTLVDALGTILGEQAVRAAGAVHTTDRARILGKQEVVTCPGRKLEPGPRPRKEYKWEDSDPVNIRLSLLMINDIALAGVSGEPLTMIYQHLMKETPFTHTVMVAHANGSSGYIPDDAAFGQISYEIATSHLKPGCAENSIVNGFLNLMDQR
ncbi:MAG: neutral/alkaline non-lysosomal ceramidase N-terminal domain-containing protein [Bryobacteraceae bacterium]